MKGKRSMAALLSLPLVPILMGLGPSEQAVPTRWALIVGVSDYIHLEDVEGGDLPGAERDARVMRDVLVQKWGFPEENVRVLLNGDATRAAIEEGLTGWLPSRVGPADHVTVFFAGHGSQMWDENGDEDDGLDETIAPADVRPETTRFDISDDQFGAWLDGLPTTNVVVYLDNCNSGTGTRDVTPFSRTRMLGRDLSRLERPGSLGRRALPGQSEDATGFDAGGGQVLELAAAQPHQAAVDAYFPAEEGGDAFHGGAFTTFLVRELWRAPAGTSYEEVFDRVRNALRENRFSQDPYLSEQAPMKDAPLFYAEGAEEAVSETALPVLSSSAGEVELGGGQSLGITTGSVFATPAGGRLVVESVTPERARARVAVGSVTAGDRARLVGYRMPARPLRVNVGALGTAGRELVERSLSDVESIEIVDDPNAFSHLLLRRRGEAIRVIGLDGATRETVPRGEAGAEELAVQLRKEAAAKQLGDLVNPSQEFGLDVGLTDGSRALGLGESVSFSARSERDGYLTLVDLGTDGQVTVLLPNPYREDNRVAAGETYTFPSPEMGFEIQAQPPAGRGTVRAFLTSEPLDLPTAGDRLTSGDVLLAERIAEAVAAAAGPVEDGRRAIRLDTWGTASAVYEIEP